VAELAFVGVHATAAVLRLRLRVERGEALPYPDGTMPPAVSPPR
jgi:hypothetical protein